MKDEARRHRARPVFDGHDLAGSVEPTTMAGRPRPTS
jgi:hypothetical protein